MNSMRLVFAALALSACATPATVPIASVAADPGPASVVPGDAPYHPPYAMLFHEGNSWQLPVHSAKLAMVERGVQGEVNCTVEHVEQYCDRRISNVTCEGAGARLLSGQYSASWDGLWKADSADSSTELVPESMLIARLPPFQQTTDKVATKPWGAAWCVIGTDETLCIQPGRGLIGAIDADYVIGEVPRKL
jgi:hypothetical protein